MSKKYRYGVLNGIIVLGMTTLVVLCFIWPLLTYFYLGILLILGPPLLVISIIVGNTIVYIRKCREGKI